MAHSRSRRQFHALIARAGVAVFAVFVIAVPNASHADAVRDQQWHLDYLDIAQAHKITQGEGVTVAVLDTGVDHRHPDLRGAVGEGQTFAGGPAGGRGDTVGHGTAIASLIAGMGHGPGHKDGVLGIAPAAKVLPIRVSSPDSSGHSPRALDQGIDWAVDHNADIINLSLSDIDNPYVEQAIQEAQEDGALIIASAGNTADGDEEVTWPARYPGVLAVSGTDKNGDFTNASVSGPQVGISAPATDIMAADTADRGHYAAGIGTSGSAAIVSGVAALIKAGHPDIDANNIINQLIKTGDDQGPRGRDAKYGYGIVNPVAALNDNVPRVDRNPLLKPTAAPADSTSRAPAHRPGRTAARLMITLGIVLAVSLGGGGLWLRRRSRNTSQ